VSTLGWVAVAALAVALAATVAALRTTRARLAVVERRLGDLDTRADDAVRTARGAAALARQAGAGEPDDEPPRVVLEPVTGPLVKAVAWSAGARRAATRLVQTVRSEPR